MHIILLNNFADDDKLSIIMENSNVTHSEENNSELERLMNQRFIEPEVWWGINSKYREKSQQLSLVQIKYKMILRA